MKSAFLIAWTVLASVVMSATAAEMYPSATVEQSDQSVELPPIQKLSQNIVSRLSFEEQLLALTNIERRKVGLPPLRLSRQLSQAAQAHAVDMGRNGYFSHTGLNGSSMVDRAKATGYRYAALGENLAAGRATPEGTIRQWMNSAGHRANILSNKFTEIGFGYANAPNARYRHYWVQVFGRPQR